LNSKINKKESSVLFILEDGRLAGPHVYVARLCSRLKIKNRVLLPNSADDFVKLLTELDIDFKQTFFLSGLSKDPIKLIRYLVFFVPELIFLFFFFIKAKEKIIYCSGGAWQIKAAISGKLARKKVIWHLNDTEMPSIIRKVFSILSKLSDGFIFASNASKSYYKPLIKNLDGRVIPSPVDDTFFSLHKDIKLEKWEKKIVIGTVSNINPTKNLEDFIYVAENMQDKYDKSLHFVIIGPIYSSQEKYFKKLTNEIGKKNLTNIEFLGATDSVGSYLKRFDYFLFTSSSESSPLAVWEAMLFSLPIISYDVGDIGKYIQLDKSGILVKKGDREGLCKGLSELINNQKKSSLLGNYAREVCLSEFSAEKCAAKHLEYFKNFI